MLESYEEYLKRTGLKDCKNSWIDWKIEVYKYPRAKARKRAETQYYPLNPVDMEQTKIGLNIKYLRMHIGMTQIELADKLGLDDNMIISRWERGIYLPDASQIKLLSAFFNVSSNELLHSELFGNFVFDKQRIVKPIDKVSSYSIKGNYDGKEIEYFYYTKGHFYMLKVLIDGIQQGKVKRISSKEFVENYNSSQ